MSRRLSKTPDTRVNKTYALRPDIIHLLDTTAEKCIRHLQMPANAIRRRIVEEGIRLACRKYARMIQYRWDGEERREEPEPEWEQG